MQPQGGYERTGTQQPGQQQHPGQQPQGGGRGGYGTQQQGQGQPGQEQQGGDQGGLQAVVQLAEKVITGQMELIKELVQKIGGGGQEHPGGQGAQHGSSPSPYSGSSGGR